MVNFFGEVPSLLRFRFPEGGGIGQSLWPVN